MRASYRRRATGSFSAVMIKDQGPTAYRAHSVGQAERNKLA
jgi:hypothetical protein